MKIKLKQDKNLKAEKTTDFKNNHRNNTTWKFKLITTRHKKDIHYSQPQIKGNIHKARATPNVTIAL